MASDYRAYTSACKVHTDPMYPCKYLKIRSIPCCYFWKQYLTILVLIVPTLIVLKIFVVPVVYYPWFKFLKGCFHDCSYPSMKIWQACLNYPWALETFRIVSENGIYAGWIFRIFGSLIRHLRSHVSLNRAFEVKRITENVISLLSMPTLKSSKTMKFSYLDEYKAKPFFRISLCGFMWLLIAFLFGL